MVSDPVLMTHRNRVRLSTLVAAIALVASGGSTTLLSQRQGGAATPPSKRLLFLTHAGLYKHPSLGPAEQAVIAMGKTGGFAVTTVEGYKAEAWSRNYGKGRVFYTSMGHRDDIWSVDPVFQAHVTGGIRWTLGLEE
jgi:hypothetical protein